MLGNMESLMPSQLRWLHNQPPIGLFLFCFISSANNPESGRTCNEKYTTSLDNTKLCISRWDHSMNVQGIKSTLRSAKAVGRAKDRLELIFGILAVAEAFSS